MVVVVHRRRRRDHGSCSDEGHGIWINMKRGEMRRVGVVGAWEWVTGELVGREHVVTAVGEGINIYS